MMRSWLSTIARDVHVALSAPRSDVPPPLPSCRLLESAAPILHLELRPEQRVVQRHVDDRILATAGAPCASRAPTTPTRSAPEIVGPEESALQQILAQPFGFLVVEVDAPTSVIMMNGHWNSVSSVSRMSEVVRVARRRPADRCLGEFGQPDREVDVGARPVHVPVAAVAARIVAEHDPAELEGAVEVGGARDAERAEIAEELRLDARGHSEAGNHREWRQARAVESASGPRG